MIWTVGGKRVRFDRLVKAELTWVCLVTAVAFSESEGIVSVTIYDVRDSSLSRHLLDGLGLSARGLYDHAHGLSIV